MGVLMQDCWWTERRKVYGNCSQNCIIFCEAQRL